MAHHAANSSQPKSNDFDRQFEEDLERARALSLESLALEKFRLQKLELEKNKVQDRRPSQIEERRMSQQEDTQSSSRQSRLEIKSRPRPGSFNTGAPRVPRIIAPPPAVLRRNSSTAGPAAVVATASTSSDLISFNSPSPVDKSHSVFEQFNPNPNVRVSLEQRFVSTTITPHSIASSSVSVNSQAIVPFTQSFPSSPNLIRPSLSNTTPFFNTPLVEIKRPEPENKTPLAITDGLNLDVLKLIGKQDNSNLIDLNPHDAPYVPTRVSVLEAFDPLLKESQQQQQKHSDSPAHPNDDEESQCSSIYDVYDPFEYMNAPTRGTSTHVEPVYATVNKKGSPIKEASSVADGAAAPPPLPPRSASLTDCHRPSLEKRSLRKTKLYENISLVKKKGELYDKDLQSFHTMVQKLREEFPYTDACTNVGLVISPTLDSSYSEGTSIKLIVNCKGSPSPVTFTCDVSSSIEHVILHVVCELEGDLKDSVNDYVLKVCGLAEYFSSNSCLADYDYVHQCMKLEQDVTLTIMKLEEVKRPLVRTLQDDNNDKTLQLEDLLPTEPVRPITYDTLVILLETLEREMDRLLTQTQTVDPNSRPGSGLHFKGVWQAVKAVCALLGNVETLQITEALDYLSSACLQFSPTVDLGDYKSVLRPEIIHEDGNYSIVTLSRQVDLSSCCESVQVGIDRLREAVQSLIEAYCQAFRVAFQLEPRSELPAVVRGLQEISDCVCVHVGALHRLCPAWQHQDYQVSMQLYHGTRPISHEDMSSPVTPSNGLYQRIVFDCWLSAHLMPLCMLPRESRLVIVLYGRTLLPSDSGEEPKMERVELGWTALQFFDCQGYLSQGNFLLSLWPSGADKRLGPAPAPGTHPHGDKHPVFGVELPEWGSQIQFLQTVEECTLPMHDFSSLDDGTQEQLLVIAEQDTFTNPPVEEREILWEKRHYLHQHPEALPKVLLAAHSWDWSSLPDLHTMLKNWTRMEPVSALTLLLPCFPDTEVRRVALGWVRHIGCDELGDYLPQLVQALKHETWEASSLAHFLLERALSSPSLAHHLYWLLTQALPGPCPQNSTDGVSADESGVCQARYQRRLQLMLRALLAICGEAMRQRFMSQQLLVKNLAEVAENVKGCKESLRLSVLGQGLEVVHHALRDTPTCLPLKPSLEVGGLHIRSCSFFHSNTLPLKLNFLSLEQDGEIIPAIFKVGDDLQQDMLTIQMIQIMDKLWLKEGLDLKMVTFACVPTGHKRGMIEMVTSAETLRKIQVELGLTGSFKDRPIAEWLAKHNPSALEYERAVENFTASCAGYCVATYVLGICDRHNDNIMLKTSGHMFHIDFGKFLGDAQMFGNIKRDRTPFVLTSDMAYVINGGDKPSVKFHHFVDLCCQAFNIIRRHRNLLLNLFGLMVSSGIPGVTMDAVKYVQKALLPDHSNVEAAAMFARMIESSLRSWFTQFNFFLHNLAQLQFSGSHSEGELLSFIPSVFTMQREGRIRQVSVHGIQKRYDPEKCYLYIIRVERANQPDPSYLFRSYREFCELHEKLCLHFPLAKLHSLPTGIHVGRSNIKQVAEKRKQEIERFLRSVFLMADEIAHSDFVYTFFHPILRDQQEANIHARKVKETRPVGRTAGEGRVLGQIKLSLEYQRGALLVMVHHARELPAVNGQEPSTYVKVYLRPDPAKATKRKTKVVRRSCHPSFMEMLEYRLPLSIIRQRRLEATVWSRDPLQENEFLGGMILSLGDLPLSGETAAEWYSLGNVPRAH